VGRYTRSSCCKPSERISDFRIANACNSHACNNSGKVLIYELEESSDNFGRVKEKDHNQETREVKSHGWIYEAR
jgi:hypothetical protein